MKFAHLAAFLALAASAFAAGENRGSYAAVTSTLTVTTETRAPVTVLKNGDRQTVAVWTTFKVTNAAILAECQRQGILSAGSIAAWKIYAIFDSDGLVAFVINNGLQTVSIEDVITVRRNVISGFAGKGKWQRNTGGDLVSGGSTYLDGFLLDVFIDGVGYTTTCAPQITDKVVSFGVLAPSVWRPGAFKINVVGLSDAEEGNGAIMRGALSLGAAKAHWDLAIPLFGFPGFAE